MSELFHNNQYDADIINQPEIEYRTAKYPFRMRHHYIDSTTNKKKHGILRIVLSVFGITKYTACGIP